MCTLSHVPLFVFPWTAILNSKGYYARFSEMETDAQV